MIRFGRETEKYGELSNFWLHTTPLQWNGKSYKTAEHLYQSLKYLYDGASQTTTSYAEIIRNAKTPYQAKLFANKCKHSRYSWQDEIVRIVKENDDAIRDPDWETNCHDAMKQALTLKFNQDLHCRNVLLSTSGSSLVEHSATDAFWADGGDGRGQNYLGRYLVETREKLLLVDQSTEKPIHPLFRKESNSKRSKLEST